MSRGKPRAASTWPTRPGVEFIWCRTMRIGLRAIVLRIASAQLAVGQRQHNPARHVAEEGDDNFVWQPGNHDSASHHEAAIAVAGDLLCRALEHARRVFAHKAGPRLEFGG